MIDYFPSKIIEIKEEEVAAINTYHDILRKNIDNVYEYNIFWVFWRNSRWMQMPIDRRVVDVYIVIELKKMIEYSEE